MLSKLFSGVGATIAAMVAHAAMAELAELTGPQKQAQVLGAVLPLIDGVLPGWAAPVVKALAPALLGAVVAFANRTGFFEHSSTASAAPLSAVPAS